MLEQSCPDCRVALEPGSLLVGSAVYWAVTPTPLLPTADAFPGIEPELGHYHSRPVALPAARCRRCALCVVTPNSSCTHALETGWFFPYAKLRWVTQGVTFIPTFLYPFSARGKGGVTPETLFSPGFRVHIAESRCPGQRCTLCGAVVIRYSEAPVALAAPA